MMLASMMYNLCMAMAFTYEVQSQALVCWYKASLPDPCRLPEIAIPCGHPWQVRAAVGVGRARSMLRVLSAGSGMR